MLRKKSLRNKTWAKVFKEPAQHPDAPPLQDLVEPKPWRKASEWVCKGDPELAGSKSHDPATLQDAQSSGARAAASLRRAASSSSSVSTPGRRRITGAAAGSAARATRTPMSMGSAMLAVLPPGGALQSSPAGAAPGVMTPGSVASTFVGGGAGAPSALAHPTSFPSGLLASPAPTALKATSGSQADQPASSAVVVSTTSFQPGRDSVFSFASPGVTPLSLAGTKNVATSAPLPAGRPSSGSVRDNGLAGGGGVDGGAASTHTHASAVASPAVSGGRSSPGEARNAGAMARGRSRKGGLETTARQVTSGGVLQVSCSAGGGTVNGSADESSAGVMGEASASAPASSPASAARFTFGPPPAAGATSSTPGPPLAPSAPSDATMAATAAARRATENAVRAAADKARVEAKAKVDAEREAAAASRRAAAASALLEKAQEEARVLEAERWAERALSNGALVSIEVVDKVGGKRRHEGSRRNGSRGLIRLLFLNVRK